MTYNKRASCRTLVIELRGFLWETPGQGEANPQTTPYFSPDELVLPPIVIASLSGSNP